MIRFIRWLLLAAGLLSAFLIWISAFEKNLPAKLSGDYEIWRTSVYDRAVCLTEPERPNIGHIVIPSYVDAVAFDQDYVFAQHLQKNKDQYPPISENSERSYYSIVIATGEVLGPMTEAEFEEWYAALGREEPPKWISTKNQPALIDRWEELNPGQSYE